jgi:hypothetical protein
LQVGSAQSIGDSQVFQFRTMTTAAKGAFAALALGGALLAAPSANAAGVTLISATMNQGYTATITGAFYPTGVNAYIGPVNFVANAGAGDFNFMAFCVDLYHDMYINQTLNYAYHDEALTTDSSTSTPSGQAGVSIVSELNKISSLLNYANYVTATTMNLTTRAEQLAGIQGAIWKIENPGYSIVSGNSQVTAYMTTYVADAAVASYMPVGKMKSIYANDYKHQAFAYGAGAPEPAAWALMIVGFGTAGAALRRRRPAARAA